ncbi:hypothetical protein NL676_002524 [Syzygium grande]|nr:hypothetical protein NL676_002524 [Syzygium grande]
MSSWVVVAFMVLISGIVVVMTVAIGGRRNSRRKWKFLPSMEIPENQRVKLVRHKFKGQSLLFGGKTGGEASVRRQNTSYNMVKDANAVKEAIFA